MENSTTKLGKNSLGTIPKRIQNILTMIINLRFVTFTNVYSCTDIQWL